MSTGPGLRERKKERTRQQIGEAAQRLFSQRGFDAVTVADVAREADVSVGTVFNYFPTKEELFYTGMEAFEVRLVEAVRERPPGQSVLAAFRDFVLAGTSRLATEEVADLIGSAARVVEGSPALQARERQVVAEFTDELADLIGKEHGRSAGAVEAWAVANALMGVQRALVADVRARVLDGIKGPPLAAAARAQGKRAFALLESGLGDYATKGAASTGAAASSSRSSSTRSPSTSTPSQRRSTKR